MRLSDYLEKTGVSQAAFAAKIGKRQQEVFRYAAGTIIPRPDTMALIVIATGGQVQPNDFYADWIAKARAALLSSASPGALLAGRR